MPHAAVVIAPGVDYFPGFLDRAAQEALRDEVLAILEPRAAVSPAHAAHRQAVFGLDEQLRPARLGLGRSRLSLSADPSGDRTPVAGDAAEAPRRLRSDRPRRAAAGGLPHQCLRLRRADGPAPGPRRRGTLRPRRLAIARRYGAVPGRRASTQRADPLLPPRLGRRDVACRRGPSRVPRRRPHHRRLVDPPASRAAGSI